MDKTRTKLIHSDKTIGFLDEFKGHVFHGYEKYVDPGAAEMDRELYHLEFSSETAQEQLLTPAEQKEVLRCFRVRSEHGNSLAYDTLHTKLCERLLPDVDGGE